MTYKTLMLKIYRPSKIKREIMDRAINQYSQALRFLLCRYRKKLLEIASCNNTVNRTVLLGLIDKETSKQLNLFDVQPFKDSLKIEFAAIAANFIAQRHISRNARFPKISKSAAKSTNPHPMYFGRYALNRDYCLLYDSISKRFYAKIYLLNAKNKINSGEHQGRLQLQYISEGMPEVLRKAEARRFIVVPLAFGKYQLKDLNRLLENPGLARTARLKKVNNEYFLLVNIVCETRKKEITESTMGIARSMNGGLHYTVCNADGVVESGIIEKKAPECQKLYLLAKSAIEICKRHSSQVIVEANGGKNDKLTLKCEAGDKPLTTTEYSQFVKILSYKLTEEGLPLPARLSASRLFATCPACSSSSQKSRISPRLFVCVECGYASGIDEVGSMNLIIKLKNYRNGQIPVVLKKYPDKLVFTNRILGFECELNSVSPDYSQMFYELNLFVHKPIEGKINCKKYAMLKKLQSASDIESSVRIIEKTANI